MRKLILRSDLPPGDIVLLTAAVRDLHLCYPGEFATDVRTSFPELWQHNPYLTPLDEHDPRVEVVDCEFPLIDQSNQAPYHSLHAFAQFLSDRFNLDIRLTRFHGDIHLSAEEKSWMSQVHELTGRDTPFWLVVAGGKHDYTIKWWAAERYQRVVDHFRGRIQFVQVGAVGDHHPGLEGVIDLRGQTDLRQLVRLVYHAQGVLCPVTSLMHLAAAVEVKARRPAHRACVVVAGGREPPHWEAYPGHQLVHTVGMLSCCRNGGCWRSRTQPLGDGSERDRPEELCVDVVRGLPRCMDLIRAPEIIRRIQSYFDGGALRYLRPVQAAAARRALRRQGPNPFDECLTPASARRAAEEYIRRIPAYPGGCSGRGIVICAGGSDYFANAWVCVQMLRRVGCSLPIQIWHLGDDECDGRMRALIAPAHVECVDALQVRQRHPARILQGWAVKPYAILHCPFRQVLLLDADNVPVRDPTFLFDTPEFKRTGAIFWPDFGRLERTRPIWKFCGIRFRDEPEFETGQVLVDKRRCWRSLSLALWYNEHADFFYHHIHGDKETFHLAFRKLHKPYAMPRRAIHALAGTMCQHDFRGRRLFQHRNLAKWRLFGPNPRIRGFRFEPECLEYLRNLRQQWEGAHDVRTVIIQQASGLHTRMLDLTEPRHRAYAARFGFGFWSIRGQTQFTRPPVWHKIPLIRQALALGFDLVVWLDADTLIRDASADLRRALRPGAPIGMCRHPVAWNGQPWHYNAGVVFIRNTALSRRFFDQVWEAGPTSHRWQEQIRMNELARKHPRAVQPLEPRWNSTPSINPCPSPVIQAWHGQGGAALEGMRGALQDLAPLEPGTGRA